MSNKGLGNFYLGIVLPSILAISLFIISIYALIIPSFEKNMKERKKEMIRELTSTSLNIIEQYNQE
ncbi:hypothetical protein ACFL6I_05210 [candidate division KSB1 bacterium]